MESIGQLENIKPENFEIYMSFFKDQPLKEKRNIVIEQLKILATITNTMCKELNVENEIILNRELLDLNQENYTEDDFAEAAIVLINSIQNSLCDFDLKLTRIFESIEEDSK